MYKKAGDERTKDLELQCSCTIETPSENLNNCIFNLPLNHPVIDFVGVFVDTENRKWIVFVILVMAAKLHICVGHFPKPFKQQYVLKYYTDFFKVDEVYFSPRESSIPQKLEKEAVDFNTSIAEKFPEVTVYQARRKEIKSGEAMVT